MGGGLGFLMKKTWHPARIQNVEQVWKKEQEKEKEERKLEELRKQIQEERDRDALLQQAEQGGHLERTARLDWMYMGGMQGQAAAQQREAEEARKEEQRAPLTHTEAPGKGSLPTLPSFYTAATPAAQNEMWQRMTNDPLVAIKQQEKAALERLRSNPVVMNRIKAEVAGALSPRAGSSAMASEKKEKKEKKDKKEKKEKREKRDRDHRRDRRDSPPPEGRSRSPAGEPWGEGQRRRSRSRDRRNGDQWWVPSGHRDGHRDERRDGQRDGHRDERGDGYRDGHRDGRRDDRHDGHRDGHRDERRDGHRDEKRDDRHDGHRDGHRDGDQRAGEAGALSYGLNFNRDVGDAEVAGTAARAEGTRVRLQEAEERARKEEEERRAEEERRRRRGQYRPGQMTEEERARRLAEMAGNAEEHESSRTRRLRMLKEQEEREAKELERRMAERDPHHKGRFMAAVEKEVSGTGAGGGTLSDRVRGRAFLSQRGAGDG